MEPGSALFTLGCESSLNFSPTSKRSAKNYLATYHAAGENKCERGEVDSVRTLFACFG